MQTTLCTLGCCSAHSRVCLTRCRTAAIMSPKRRAGSMALRLATHTACLRLGYAHSMHIACRKVTSLMQLVLARWSAIATQREWVLVNASSSMCMQRCIMMKGRYRTHIKNSTAAVLQLHGVPACRSCFTFLLCMLCPCASFVG
jgi:exosortase/archaeosortase